MGKAGGIRAGKAFVEVGMDDRVARGLRSVHRQLTAFGAGVRSIGMKLAALGGAVTAPLMGAGKTFAGMGDTLDKMAARTGMSVETLSELSFAAEQSGADLETLETGLRRMQRSIVDAARGSQTAVAALRLLGLSVQSLAGLTPERQFKLIADQLSKIGDPTLRAALAMELFSRSGTRLLPMLRDGAAGIEAFQQEARDLGLTISSEAARDAALMNDTFNILRRTLKQAAFTIGSALAPTLTELAGRITRAVVVTTNWLAENRAAIVTALKVAAAVTAAGASLIALGTVIVGVGAVFGTLAGAVTAVGTVLGTLGAAVAALVSPIGLVIAAIVALKTTTLDYAEAGAGALGWLTDTFQWFKGSVLKVVGEIRDALAAGDIPLAAKILWLALKLAWEKGADALNRVWIKAKQLFVQTAYDMWYGALFAAQTVWRWLEVGWIETTAFLSKTWTRFVETVQKAWHWCSKQLAKAWNWLRGLFDSSFDAEAANRAADEYYEAQKAEIEKKAGQKIADRERRRQEQREQSRKVHEETLAEIGRKWADAEQDIGKKTAEQIAGTREALEKARRELHEAIAEAQQKRELAEVAGPPRPGRRPIELLEEQVAGLGDLLARKVTVAGTFNPAALFGLGPISVEERIARATEETARLTKRLVERDPGGRFEP